MSDDFDRLEKYYKLYRAVPDQAFYNVVSRSQYVVPVIYKTVETILPRILSVLFSVTPPIQSRYRMMGPDFKLKCLDAYFDYLFDRTSLYWIVQGWLKSKIIYGQSYLKVGWMQQKRKTVVQAPVIGDDGLPVIDQHGQMVLDPKTTEEIVEDGLDVQNVNIFSLFFSPEAHFPQPFKTSKGVCHKTQKRKSQVLAMRDAGLYLDFDDNDLRPAEADNDPSKKIRTALNRESYAPEDKDDPMIDLYEYWEDERLVLEANHRVLLRDEGNPFGLPGRPKRKPFVSSVNTLVEGDLWQIGEAEVLWHNQVERSTLRRQRTDNNTLIINRGWIYNKDAEVDLESLELSRPGMAVGCRPQVGESVASVIQPLVQGDINGASYKEDQDLDKDSQETSGLLDYAVGSAPERRETATTVQLLQNAANLRFDIKIRNDSDSFLDLGYMIFERAKQLQTKPLDLAVTIPGMQKPIYVKLTKEELPDYEAVDLVAPGNPNMLLKDARQQKILQYVENIKTTPGANPMAAVELLKVGLREAEIDGIEPVIAMLSMPMPMMGPEMGGAPMPGGNGASPATPPQAEGPPMPSGGVNENPLVMPPPHPRN